MPLDSKSEIYMRKLQMRLVDLILPNRSNVANEQYHCSLKIIYFLFENEDLDSTCLPKTIFF